MCFHVRVCTPHNAGSFAWDDSDREPRSSDGTQPPGVHRRREHEMSETTESKQPITQAEYLEAELGHLLRRLADGDKDAAATSLATLRQELHIIGLGVDPNREALARITTSNGRYYLWDVLAEGADRG